MVDRSKQLSKDTWRDPTQSLSRIKALDIKVRKVVIKYMKAVLEEMNNTVNTIHIQKVDSRLPYDLNTSNFFYRLDQMAAAAANEVSDLLGYEIPNAYGHGELFADRQVKTVMGGLTLPMGAYQQSERLKTTATLVDKSKSQFVGILEATNQDIKRKISQGLLDGTSYGDVTDDIVTSFENIAEYRAETMVRTEIMSAINQGIKDRYDVMGIEQVEWLAADDERTCDTCGAYDGQIYDLGSEPDCPAHPNCRCTLIVHIVVEEEE